MKRTVKKRTGMRSAAALLAVLMAVQSPLGRTGAMGMPQKNQRTRMTATMSDAAAGEEALAGLLEERNGILKVEVQGVVKAPEITWNVELYPSEEGDASMAEPAFGSLTLPAGDGNTYTEGSCELTELPDGTYDLRMEPENDTVSYVAYEQKGIRIQGDMVSIRLMNDAPENHGYGESGAGSRIGVLAMGDIDGSGAVDEDDKEELLKLAASGQVHDDLFYDRADLNGDGQVDLADVACFAKYYKEDVRTAREIRTMRITEEEIYTASASNAEISQGTVEQLFSGAASLTLESEEAISEENPVTISAEFGSGKTMAGFVIDPVDGSGNTIVDGTVSVETEKGKEKVFEIENGKVKERSLGRALLEFFTGKEETVSQGGPIVIDLKGQTAVKKVTIKVSRTLGNTALVDIAKVEFLGDMKERIPEPEMAAPERVQVENGDASFTVTWRRQPNVTGYEVTVHGVNSKKNEVTQIFQTDKPEFRAEDLGDGALANGNSYEIQIRSVNGAWKSPAAEAVGQPRAASLPPAPENITVTSRYKGLSISWKDMMDTDSYNLYYRKYDDSQGVYTKIPDIRENRYELKGLEDKTKYDVYLTGVNLLGEGPESVHYTGVTAALDPPVTPDYKRINVEVPGEPVTAHIESVRYGSGDYKGEYDIVDGDYETSWVRNDWDSGATYYDLNKAPIVSFDGSYEMDTFVVIPDGEQPYSYNKAVVYYWTDRNDIQDSTKNSVAGVLEKKTSNNKAYYEFRADRPIEAEAVQLVLSTADGNNRRISMAELKFYYYDPLEDEIMDLYGDPYHVSLRSDVDRETMGKRIQSLKDRLDQPDPVSGELHPRKEILETELANAERILKDGALQAEILAVDSKDTGNSDSHITFKGGLNTYQPLGVTARAGETVTVYVGSPAHKTGDGTRLQLVQTQYHGSSAAWTRTLGNLKAGANDFTLEALDHMDLERGGQLYVVYTGEAGREQYGVRVSGGTKIPVLDLSDTKDPAERLKLAEAYVNGLEAMVQDMEALHNRDHQDYSYDEKNCIYGATDIVSRYTMISGPSDQILEGLAGNTAEEKAAALEQSMTAMDQMVELFYAHKGLSTASDAKEYNRVPAGRLNIRYQRMFAGAFMYAGGLHIGIEWPQFKEMVNGKPVIADEEGRYQSGSLFGWGLSHEIGHEINEGAYAVAEVTNNYYPLLAQARDTNASLRFKYEDVFKKTTSGARGKASDGAVQLAMYWQLHLAYDMGGYNFKTFDTSKEQLENLIFARMDSYVRNLESAPGAEGNKLKLSGTDKDNVLMRLAAAAARKDLLDFFRHWGMEPDADTVRYASQFEKEERGIWFANDENRVWQMEKRNTSQETETSAKGSVPQGTIQYVNGENQVNLEISGDTNVWIYEIVRCEMDGGTEKKQSVGYAYAHDGEAVFTDVAATANNRVYTYEITGYDKWLAKTAPGRTGEVKVSHRGDIDRTLWTVSTNLTNSELEEPGEDHPDTYVQPGLEKMVDLETEGAVTTFTGSVKAGQTPEIILELNQPELVTGLVYTAAEGTPIGKFSVSVSQDGSSWERVPVSADTFTLEDGSQTVYFHDGTVLYTYDAAFVKLTADDQGGRELSISDLSLLGQTGDNVEMDAAGMGRLTKDFAINGGADGVIPEGSIVFTGTYKGNPAYNVVLLWDENGQIVGGTDADGNIQAESLILAKVPENGLLGEVSDGIWIYYLPEGTSLPKHVRAELYRVDDAETLEGQRTVSSSLTITVPESLPELELDPGSGPAAGNERLRKRDGLWGRTREGEKN